MSNSNPRAPGLAFSLKRAQHAFRTHVDGALRPLGLTAPQFAILDAAATDPGISSAGLARAAFVTPQTMQGILANMIRAGLLRRAASPRNKRVLRTELTEKGHHVLAEARHVVDAIEDRMRTAVGATAVDDLIAALTRCATVLSDPE